VDGHPHAVELHLQPSSARFDALDDRWLAQVSTFGVELDREVGGVTRHRTPEAGTKGALDSILLSIGSAGVLTATIEFVKAWLQRDSSRSVKVSFSDSGQLQQVELSGEQLDPAALQALVRSITERLAARP
jgi:hypothetical protein